MKPFKLNKEYGKSNNRYRGDKITAIAGSKPGR